MVQSTEQKLLSILRAEGPLSPASLMGRLRLSQPTLFRSAKAQPKTIVALGAPRNRKLAALRSVRGLGASTPVFTISQEGSVVPIGRILSLYPTSFVFLLDSAPTQPQFYPGLPFFVDDARPQGFLGRSFGHKHPELKLPQRIVDWSHDDILEAMACRGEDLPGNLLVGAESFERYQGLRKSSIETVDALSPERHYLVRAQAAVDGQPTGSSAGGEQPKFSAAVLQTDGIVKRVLVKFSPSGDSFSAQRWRDLLICESLALEVLRDSGFATAESRILEGGGRTFLETIRFDRIGNHGRKGTVSLAAFENEWIGHGVNWSVSADSLERGKWISSEDLKTIQRIECFGRLIANSDRHPGNLSFFWQPGDDRATLAPVYDMLPMLYAPSSGGEDTRKVFTLPFYDHTLLSVWKDAVSIATVYWERVVEDSRLSREFRKIAEHNRLALR